MQGTEGLNREQVINKLVMGQMELLLPHSCRDFVQAPTPQAMAKEIQSFFIERGSSRGGRNGGPPAYHSYQDSGHWQQNHSPKESHPPHPDTSRFFSRTPGNSLMQEQQPRQGWQMPYDRRCFKCHGTGHFARNCPERSQRVNRVQQGRDEFLVNAEVNGVPAKALIDSGADVTVVPAHLVSLSAYTGEKLWTGSLGWSGSLPKARLTLSLQGHKTDMTVVVKEGIPEVLVGRDFPGIFDLLIHSSTIAKQKGFDKYPTMTNQVAPTQMMVGEGSKSLAAEAEDQVTPMQTMVGEGSKSLAVEAEDQVAPTQTMVGEGSKSLAAEAEDTEVIGEAADIQAVQTRAQSSEEAR